MTPVRTMVILLLCSLLAAAACDEKKAGALVSGQLEALIEGADDGTIEAHVQKGTEVAKVASRLSAAVDSDTTIMPIYRPPRAEGA